MNPDIQLRDALRAMCQGTEALADAMVRSINPTERAAGRAALRATQDARESIQAHEQARP